MLIGDPRTGPSPQPSTRMGPAHMGNPDLLKLVQLGIPSPEPPPPHLLKIAQSMKQTVGLRLKGILAVSVNTFIIIQNSIPGII